MSDERARLEAEMERLKQQMATLQAQLSGAGNIVSGEDNIAVTATESSTAIGRVEGNVYIGPPPADSTEALTIYRQVLVQSCAHLPLRGVDVGASDPTTAQSSLRLANVYVELDTTSKTPFVEAVKGVLSGGAASAKSQEARSLSALEAVIGYRRLVLLGDPGGGKSTFVNHLAHCLATHTLEPAAKWLELLPGWPAAEAGILPLLVILRDFAQSLPNPLPRQAEPHHLWDFMTTRLAAQNLAFAVDPIQKCLEQGRALVLLDGLDEVPAVEQRLFVRDAVYKFMNRYPTNRYLLTCRTLSYQPPASPNQPDLRLPSAVSSFELARFDEKKIDRFIAAWYAELVRLGTVRSEDQEGLTRQLRQAVRRPDIRRLAPNPLLLTVIALVHTHKGRLPEARAMLYEETVDLLLWRWEQVKGDAPRLRQLLLAAERADTDLKRVLWQLAYEAQAQGGADESTPSLAGIGQWPLQKALAALKENDHNWARQVIEAMKLRAGLLLEREPEVFTFPHRTFQEYLAGAYLASQGDFAQQACRRAEAGALWREVILLAVGRLVYLAGDTDKPLFLVGELCPARPKNDEVSWRKAWLAGEVLLEIGLKRVKDSQTGQELLERVQQRLVELVSQGHLTPRERAESGDVLAKLGDPRLEVTTIEQMAFCYVPSGSFWMGEGQVLHQNEYLNYGYWIGRYPVTVAQFQAFVEAADHRVTDEDSLRDLPNRPVRYVTWYEAVAFCDWLTQKWRAEKRLPAGWAARLPSEAEWEKAARGGLETLAGSSLLTTVQQGFDLPKAVKWEQNKLAQRAYPWGDEISPDQANYDKTGINDTSAVGCFPSGQSPYGCQDMAGNVWEWTRSHLKDYPYHPDDGREDLKAGDDVRRVMRGGAFYDSSRLVRCAVRYGNSPSYWYDNIGFRVVVSPFS